MGGSLGPPLAWLTERKETMSTWLHPRAPLICVSPPPLTGSAVRPHQGDAAAWNRPRGAGADGGRGDVHAGLRRLRGGPAGEHLPAQVCE